MKITVIGYWGAYPEKNEATSGYLLEVNGSKILIDCGSGVLSKIQNYISLNDLDALVLSHYHTDHLGDTYCLQYAMMITTHIGERKRPLHIYGLGSDPKFETLAYGKVCVAHPVEDGDTVDINGASFTFIKTNHPVTCLGMRIQHENKVIGYTADSGWDDNLVKVAENNDLLLCECNLYNYQKGVIAGHLTAGEAGRVAAEGYAKGLLLTHLPHQGELTQLIAEAKETYTGEVNLAHTGWTLEI